MNDIIVPGEKRQLDFAFTRFWGLKYPVYVESRIYTSAHHGVLHNHDFPQIWYCLGGNYLHQVEDQVYECTKGSMVIIPTGVFHKFRIPEGKEAEILSLSVMYDTFLNAPMHQYMNAITSLFLPPFSKELGYTCPIFLMLGRESQTAVEAYVSWFSLLNFTQPGAVSEADILDKLEALFSLPEFVLPKEYLQNAIELIQNRLYPMMQMLSYLNHHYPEKIVEEDLLRTLGICRANRYRYFKGYTGYTCSQYLQKLRIKHVYIYLGHTSYPLSYISDMCGFYDTHHMSHAFKKYAGKSPRNFRLFKKKWLEENPQHKLHIL